MYHAKPNAPIPKATEVAAICNYQKIIEIPKEIKKINKRPAKKTNPSLMLLITATTSFLSPSES